MTTALTAHTFDVELADELDLVAEAGERGFLFEDDHGGMAARGIAVRIELPGAGTAAAALVSGILRSIEADDPAGPVAVGALPFDTDAPGALIVPSLVVRRTKMGARITRIGPREDVVHEAEWQPQRSPAPSTEPDGFSLVPEPGHRDWQSIVEQALDAIGRDDLTKVVLARAVRVEANRDIDRAIVLRRLRSLYPSCVTFAAGTFVGASPELLVARDGMAVTAHPLAGTVPRSGDPERDQQLADAMLASKKERWEHALTVDAVARTLRPRCSEITIPAAPSIVSLRNVAHLGSAIEGTLSGSPEQAPTALALAAALHPTPAVGGTPVSAALDFLRRHEGLDRGFYGGPVGWVDAAGDGQWMVGIRSAVIDGPTAQLYSGVGIVAGSNVDAELAETQFKLQALLSALVRP